MPIQQLPLMKGVGKDFRNADYIDYLPVNMLATPKEILNSSEMCIRDRRIPGEHIPLIPVYGRRSFVDNQERIEGQAAKAMDAQRLENLMVSMIADNATQAGGCLLYTSGGTVREIEV